MTGLPALEGVLDASGVAPRAEALLPSGARRRQLTVRTLLLGMMLALADGRPAHLTRVHRALVSLPEGEQRRLGVLADWKGRPHPLTCRPPRRHQQPGRRSRAPAAHGSAAVTTHVNDLHATGTRCSARRYRALRARVAHAFCQCWSVACRLRRYERGDPRCAAAEAAAAGEARDARDALSGRPRLGASWHTAGCPVARSRAREGRRAGLP